jgi:hypothetical protein
VRGRALWAPTVVEARLRHTRLRTLLRLNASFSAIAGAVAATAAGPVARALDVDGVWIVRAVGVGLVAYAADLLVVAALGHRRLGPVARAVAVADAAWVVGTAGLVAAGAVSGEGAMLLGLLAVPVAALAVGQWRAAAATVEGASSEAPPIEAVRVEVTSNADPAALWAAVGDHALFGRLAANLERVEVVEGEGEGLVRRCVARGGADWTETCTIWDPGHRHAVEVDPSGYPYPLATVGCLSYVEPDGAGAHRVGAVFQMQAEPRLTGHVMMLAMHLGRPMLRRIVRGWEREARRRPATVVHPEDGTTFR